MNPHPATQPVPPSALPEDDAGQWLEAACLGGMLPPAIEWELNAAAAAYGDDERAEQHLQRAYLLAPEHPAVHIGLYRFYFYKNRLREALAVGERCLAKAARDNGLPFAWQAVSTQLADFSSYAALPRFYLFTLKACAYLNMRLGNLNVGEDMLAKLIELDPLDRLNGSVLRDVLQRMGLDDEE